MSTSSSSPNDLEDVRKRIAKRKRRQKSAGSGSVHDSISPSDEAASDLVRNAKRIKNTLAARRYRRKRQEEIEVLDKRVKELEKELDKAKLEARWWKMEASRWRQLAEGR